MKCIRPIKASQNSDGDLVYNIKKAIPGLVPWEFPCRKCLPCRLNIAREKAIRATHEAKMHEDNIFLTLTYDDAHIGDNKLNYLDFQLFMKRLREKVTRNVTDKELKDKLHIGYMVTGEYGEQTKRQHWHAILFNYHPNDAKLKYQSKTGDLVFTSETLQKLWGKGSIEFGTVTMDSASYVARYAAKKLIHGKDEEHDYHPIHKTSSKHAIGKKWIEKHWKHTFTHGYVVLPNGEKASIPRYYVDWLKKNKEHEYEKYITTVREHSIKKAETKARKEEIEYLTSVMDRMSRWNNGEYTPPITKAKVKLTILNSKFKQLQQHLKL